MEDVKADGRNRIEELPASRAALTRLRHGGWQDAKGNQAGNYENQ